MNQHVVIPITRVVSDDMLPATDDGSGARALSARIAAGDEAAFRGLYDGYAGRVRRFVLTLARGDEAVADEVVQQTFLTAASSLRTVADEAHLWNWLARVARQHLGKVWRKRRREGSPLPLEAGPELAAEAGAERVMEQALERARVTLPAEEQALLRMFYDDRCAQRDIATRLGLTPKAVANRLERIREKLRRRIAEELDRENA